MFALIAFATAASLNGKAWGYLGTATANTNQINVGDAPVQWNGYPSYVGFMIFTGVTGWLLCMIFFGLYGTPKLQNARMLQADLAVSAIWTIFFLSAFAAMTAKLDGHCGQLFDVALSVNGTTQNGTITSNGSWCNTYKASIAFGFLSFFFWLISLVIAFLHFRKGPRTAQYQKQDLQMGGFGFGSTTGYSTGTGNMASSAAV